VHRAAHQWPAILRKHDLERLRALMSCTVKLGRAEQRDVVLLTQMVHELRDELIGWQAAEPAVLRRNNDVEPAMRVRDLAPALQAP
jgi:hypothetical protein